MDLNRIYFITNMYRLPPGGSLKAVGCEEEPSIQGKMQRHPKAPPNATDREVSRAYVECLKLVRDDQQAQCCVKAGLTQTHRILSPN